MNKSVVARNAILLVGSDIFNKMVELIGAVVIARILGVEKYGLYTFIFIVGVLFTLIQHFGFDQLVVRDLSRDKGKMGDYLVGILILKFFLSIIAVIILCIWLELFTDFSGEKKFLIYIGTIGVFFFYNIDFTNAFFRSHQKAHFEAVINIIKATLATGVTIGIAAYNGSLYHILLGRLEAWLLIFIVSIYLIKRNLKPSFSKINIKDNSIEFLKKGWAFALLLLFIFLYHKVGIIMLNVMAGDRDTGIFSIAEKIIVFFSIIPINVCNAVLPSLSENIHKSYDTFIKLYSETFRYLVMIALFIILFNTMLAKKIILLLFGQNYLESGIVLAFLTWSLLVGFINQLVNNMLIAGNKEKMILPILGIGAFCNITLNYILIPYYSYYGVVIATIFSESIVLTLEYIYLKKTIIKQGNIFFDNILLFLSGIGIIVGCNILFSEMPVIGFSIGFVLYVLFLIKFNYLSKERLIFFWGLFFKKNG